MSGVDTANYENLMKQLYTDDKIENEVYKDHAFFAMVPKFEDMEGIEWKVPVIYGNPMGRSRDFSVAQVRSLVTGVLPAAFIVTRVKDYSITTVDTEVALATKSQKGAFLEALTTASDGALQSLGNNVAVSLYRTKAGYRANVNVEPTTHATTFEIQLAEPEEITNFEVNMLVNTYAAATGGSPQTCDGSQSDFPVVGIDRDNGILTCTGTYDGSGTITAGAFITCKGDRAASISGLADWLPLVAPSATPFFGVDRTVDVTRLAGIRQDGRGKPIEQALQTLLTRCAREGGSPDSYFMNYKEWNDLNLSLGSKVQIVDLKVGTSGFRSLEIQGPKGAVKCIADQDCPAGLAYALTMKTWKLGSLGKAVRLYNLDGQTWLRLNSADGMEIRFMSFAQLACMAPGYNGVVQLA